MSISNLNICKYLFFFTVCVSICWAQVSKSQSSSASTPDVNTAKASSARSFTSDPSFGNQQLLAPPRFDIYQIVPLLIMLAFIPLVLPLITQLFAGLFTPQYSLSHGRRKRENNNGPNISKLDHLLFDIMKKMGESIEKYN